MTITRSRLAYGPPCRDFRYLPHTGYPRTSPIHSSLKVTFQFNFLNGTFVHILITSECETRLSARDIEQSKTDTGTALVGLQTKGEMGSNPRVPHNLRQVPEGEERV